VHRYGLLDARTHSPRHPKQYKKAPWRQGGLHQHTTLNRTLLHMVLLSLCQNLASHNFSRSQAMKAVAVFEAKNRFSEMIAAAEQGEDITITRHGLPVARLVSIRSPAQAQPKQAQRVAAAMLTLRQLGAHSALGGSLAQAIQNGRD